ncbi:MAG TPA: His-Xaa-Ser system protein HxsD [Verrucomicrobiae bacterium]|jgi:His-Xaa-Ser system protein HxsD|nr:His-Xaa-Ser system protein HxsD [Verrucomicrobiae bacterium]
MRQDFVSDDNGVLLVKIDMRIFSLNALLKTAYWYTGRCYLHLQTDGDDVIEARFKPKPGMNLEHLPEQFMNDLLIQSLQERVSKESEPFKNLILAHALSKTSLVNADAEAAEPFEDPKKIMISDDAKTQI